MLPHTDDGRYHGESLAWLQNIGLDALVINHAPSPTFSYFSSHEFDCASCTLELGKAKPFGHNDLPQFSGIQQGLIALLEDNLELAGPSQPLHVYKVADVLTKSSQQFRLNIADDVKNFTPFPQGFILASDGENQYAVTQETAYILFPNNHVNVGFRAGLLLEKHAELPIPMVTN